MDDLYDNRDSYRQLEYADYAGNDSHLATVFFNKSFAYYAIRADARDGWMETYIPSGFGPVTAKDLAKKLLTYNEKQCWLSSGVYLTPDQSSAMVVRLYGDVVIIKLDSKGNPVKNG